MDEFSAQVRETRAECAKELSRIYLQGAAYACFQEIDVCVDLARRHENLVAPIQLKLAALHPLHSPPVRALGALYSCGALPSFTTCVLP